ncbi:hypothetical protein BKA63DRAFT_9287 [Paraphoma chrysanthemicola]|nr:hypothetical protein BKA63DRAFT_9287 [Paraphoma chrysanthemicola]
MLRNSWLLALFALVALSAAFNFGEGLHIDGIEEYLHHGEKRQASGTGGNTPTPTPQPSSAAPPSSRQNTPTPAPTPTPTPDTETSDPPAQSTPPPGSSRPATPTQRSSGNGPSSQAPASSSRSTAIIRTTPLVSTSLSEFVTTFTSTASNGEQVAVTSTGTSSIPITTGQTTYTDAPTSQSNDGDNGGGLSDSNKKVIGGVVGGVGGALLLGGIALVFWRMKKRQHKVTADDDDLNLNTGAALGDKPQNPNGTTPFQSNLEQYHNPGGRPNAAANF